MNDSAKFLADASHAHSKALRARQEHDKGNLMPLPLLLPGDVCTARVPRILSLQISKLGHTADCRRINFSCIIEELQYVRPTTMKLITGSCLCGKVAFEVTGDPFMFLYCHCRSCQKSTGSIHAANMAFPKDSVRWMQGEELIERFVDTAENPGFPRWFCRCCGSPVPKLSRNRQFWVVPSGLLDSGPEMRPQANIYWEEHAPWYVSADQLTKHEGPLVQAASGGQR